jgi:hypothetical protein
MTSACKVVWWWRIRGLGGYETRDLSPPVLAVERSKLRHWDQTTIPPCSDFTFCILTAETIRLCYPEARLSSIGQTSNLTSDFHDCSIV